MVDCNHKVGSVFVSTMEFSKKNLKATVSGQVVSAFKLKIVFNVKTNTSSPLALSVFENGVVVRDIVQLIYVVLKPGFAECYYVKLEVGQHY